MRTVAFCSGPARRTHPLFLRRFLGPRIAERGRAIEDRSARFRIDRVGEEVAEALELKVLAGLGGGERRLELGVAHDVERVRIDVVEERLAFRRIVRDTRS